ncbi:hypothetical protein ACFVRB_43390 [Streptomyces nojiriensis]|uniref:hypothetical protein n=1 Tax=Streptomyces nojiriensis TaxID=66374 RepID=UPI0036DADC73
MREVEGLGEIPSCVRSISVAFPLHSTRRKQLGENEQHHAPIASKIPGLAKAAKGNYDDFLKWYKALDWKWRAPLAAAGLGMAIYTLWQMFQ